MPTHSATSVLGRAAAARWVALACWALLVVLVLANSYGVFTPDTKPEIYLAPARSFTLWQSAWQENPQLGFPSFNIGLAPVALVTTALSSVGLPAWLTMRVLRIALFTLGALGAAALGRRVVGRGPGPIALVAAIVYVANPYAVVAGGTLPVLWPYALLPWLVLFAYRALAEPPSWRWPAAAALTTAAMTGMNAGVVPALQFVAVIPFALLARQRAGARWWDLLRAAVRFSVLTLGMSLYWLVPAVSAMSAGQTVVSNSETVAGISGVSSWSEVLRGLGLWPLYGADATGPWLKGQSAYLTSPFVVLASFGWFVAVAVAVVLIRGRVRVWAFTGLLLAATVMVGQNPPDSPTPFGRALGWAFSTVPGLSALRTTNKAGAAFVLCAAVLVAAAVPVIRRIRPPRRRALIVGSASVLALASVAPVFVGAMYTNEMPVPEYWKSAAHDLDATGSTDRVWFLPGQVQSRYRWSDPRPDDLGNSLLTRPTLVRTVIPVSGDGAANLLAAVDSRLQNGALPFASLSAVARRLGVSDVLVRNDQVWELTAGAPPYVVQRQTDFDPGLQLRGTFGGVGENTTPATSRDPADASLHPLVWYSVQNPRGAARLLPTPGRVLVVGDGAGYLDAASAGLIPDDAPFAEAALLTDDELDALAIDSRIVLTDSNRRSTQNPGVLTNGDSPLLPSSADAGSTRALGPASMQTTLVVEGGSAVASAIGSVFGVLPNSAAENAVDGDAATAWRFGDFGHAVGQWIDVQANSPKDLSTVVVHTGPDSGTRIHRLRLEAGGRTTEATADDDGTVRLHLPGVRSRDLRLTVLATSGYGWNGVAVSEIDVPGLRLTRVAHLPDGPIDSIRTALTRDENARQVPIDIVLRRVIGVETNPDDDEESALRRTWEQPVGRSYRLSGVVRTTGELEEPLADRLAGLPTDVTAVSSTHVSADTRGSMALDDDLSTGWVPSALPNGQFLTVTGPERQIDQVLLVQPETPATGRVPALKVRIEVDGLVVAEPAVGPGARTVSFEPVRGRTLRITVLESEGFGRVEFLEAHDPGLTVTASPARAAGACVIAGYLDGRPMRVAFASPPLTAGTHPVVPCPTASPIRVQSGAHSLTSDPAWVWDSLLLRDVRGAEVSATTAYTASSSGPVTGQHIEIGARTTAAVLSIGQSYDSRWHASLAGQDLGAPILADGWSAGWELPAGAAGTVEVTYGPEKAAGWALTASAVFLVLAVFLLLWPAPTSTSPLLASDSQRGRPHGTASPAGWLGIVAVAWLVGGTVGLACSLCLGVIHLWWNPEPRRLLMAAIVSLAAMPWLFMGGNYSRFGLVTSDLVTQNPWPSYAAVVGLVLLAVGVARQEHLLPQGRMLHRDD